MEHLTDQQLQNYLDGDLPVDRREIEAHLRTCQFCRLNFATYKQLYGGLKNETGFMLSANFAEAVAAKIQSKSESKFDIFEIGLLILAGVVGVALLFYFTNLGQYFAELLKTTNTGLAAVQNHVPFLTGGKWLLFGFAALLLTIFGFLDRLIAQVKHR